MCFNTEEEYNQADEFYERSINNGYKEVFVNQIIRTHLSHYNRKRCGKNTKNDESDLVILLSLNNNNFKNYIFETMKKYETSKDDYKLPNDTVCKWKHGWIIYTPKPQKCIYALKERKGDTVLCGERTSYRTVLDENGNKIKNYGLFCSKHKMY